MRSQAVSMPMPCPTVKRRRSRAEARAVKALQAEYELVLSEFEHARSELIAAEINFKHTSGPKQTDVYIYRIQHAKSRCDSLMAQLKVLNGRIRGFNGESV